LKSNVGLLQASQDLLSNGDYLEGLLQDKKQLSEIIEDEREVEGDNGNVTYSKGTGNFGNSQTGDSGDSKALTTLQVISSMGSSQHPGQPIKGIGIGLTSASNENYNIVKSENGDERNFADRRSADEMVNNMIDRTMMREENPA